MKAAQAVCTFCGDQFHPQGSETVCRRDVRLVALGYESRAEYVAAAPADNAWTWCPRCRATWKSRKYAHCAVCHHTFSVASNFDEHLVRVCAACSVEAPCKSGRHEPDWILVHLEPSAVGLVQQEGDLGLWKAPGGDRTWNGPEAVIDPHGEAENGRAGDG